jgi:DNA-binding MarR family transcriptional regulator
MRIKKFLEESPLFNLSAAHEEILGGFQRRLGQEGVHFLQALVLTGLFFEGKPARPTELARCFCVAKSNMSHALRGLERRGWVQRSTAPGDARAYFFSLTREGKRKVPKLIQLFDRTEEQIESLLPGKKMIQLLKDFRIAYQSVSLS